MEQELFKAYKVGVLLAFMLVVSACSPRLDWRTVQSPQERYTALFPGKPDKLERQIFFEGQEFNQTLEAVKINDDIYSITTIQVPITQSAASEKFITQLKSNLLERAKASGGSVSEESGSYQTIDHQRLPTNDYFITLKSSAHSNQLMRVRWITRISSNGDTSIYQVSVLHALKDNDDAKSFLSQEQYTNFLNEFHPE
jgi:hypothetical protein